MRRRNAIGWFENFIRAKFKIAERNRFEIFRQEQNIGRVPDKRAAINFLFFSNMFHKRRAVGQLHGAQVADQFVAQSFVCRARFDDALRFAPF